MYRWISNIVEYNVRFQEINFIKNLVWLMSLAHYVMEFSLLRDTFAGSNVTTAINAVDRLKSLKIVPKLLDPLLTKFTLCIWIIFVILHIWPQYLINKEQILQEYLCWIGGGNMSVTRKSGKQKKRMVCQSTVWRDYCTHMETGMACQYYPPSVTWNMQQRRQAQHIS